MSLCHVSDCGGDSLNGGGGGISLNNYVGGIFEIIILAIVSSVTVPFPLNNCQNPQLCLDFVV